MANIANIALTILLAAQMMGAFVGRQGNAQVPGVTAITFVQSI